MERFERMRRQDRPRRTKSPVGLEPLETRALMSWSPLGFSLPDLTVSGGVAAPTAAYGQTVAVQAVIRNIGASSITEPFNMTQGAASTADMPATKLGIYVSPVPFFNRAAKLIEDVDVPAVPQNSQFFLQTLVPLPDAQTAASMGLPTTGHTIYVFFRANDTNLFQEVDLTNNSTHRGVPVLIQPALPDLKGVVFDVPQVVQPGDSLAPTIKIANYGTVDPGPVTVELVVSPSPTFDASNATVLTTFNVTNVPPLSSVPLASTGLSGDISTIYDQANVVTLPAVQVTTPTDGTTPFYVGVIVDPGHTIQELSSSNILNNPWALRPVRKVFQHYRGLPAAGILFAPAVPPHQFPTPPTGPV